MLLFLNLIFCDILKTKVKYQNYQILEMHLSIFNFNSKPLYFDNQNTVINMYEIKYFVVVCLWLQWFWRINCVLAIEKFSNQTTSLLSEYYQTNHTNYDYLGLICDPTEHYPGSTCPYGTMECCSNSTCIFWSEGKFLNRPHLTLSQLIHKYHRCIRNYDTPGKFVDDQWMYEQGCQANWFDKQEAMTLLHHRTLFFMGDSMIRQLFHRLVWYIRGFDVIIERVTHTNRVYSFNQTHDKLQVLNGFCSSSDLVDNPLSIFFFIFDPKLDKQTTNGQIEGMLSLIPSSHKRIDLIFGLNYWLKDIGYTSIERSLDIVHLFKDHILSKLYNKMHNTSAHHLMHNTSIHHSIWSQYLTVMVYTTPDAPAKLLIEDKSYPYQSPRNNILRKIYDMISFATILPSERFEANHYFLKVEEDQTHYQCIYRSPNHKFIQPLDYKSPKNQQCFDLFNLNVLQIVLNNIFNSW